MLDAILEAKREEVAARRRELSLESLLAHCEPTRRSLARALGRSRPGFLLEIKFASPSAGPIRSESDLEAVVASYGRHADAISILTDQRFFAGSLERLTEVRRRVTQPLLCKDFIIDPYQVAEARARGADAILLILAAIDDPTWRDCRRLAAGFGMEVLTEVHDQAELERAVRLGASLIGVNNRNLRTLAVDPETVARLSPRIPSDRLVVAESGIESREQVWALRPHADAFLVGTALMREVDLDRAVRHLVYGRTKVCGLTRPEHALAALASGATHGGLVFAPESPRRVTVDQADRVRRAAALDWVGVFADQDPGEVAALAERLGLRAAQLHGNESPAMVAETRARLPEGCEVWKAHPVEGMLPLPALSGADRLLLDGAPPETPSAGPAARRGGWGQRFDWRLLEEYPARGDVILAGGLGPHNAAEAAALGTFALDVSSGVETAPGEKDPDRLAAFFRARRRLPGRGGA